MKRPRKKNLIKKMYHSLIPWVRCSLFANGVCVCVCLLFLFV